MSSCRGVLVPTLTSRYLDFGCGHMAIATLQIKAPCLCDFGGFHPIPSSRLCRDIKLATARYGRLSFPAAMELARLKLTC
jgi:hypothetical protein